MDTVGFFQLKWKNICVLQVRFKHFECGVMRDAVVMTGWDYHDQVLYFDHPVTKNFAW